MKKTAMIFISVLMLVSYPLRSHAADCDIDRGPCVAIIGKTEVRLDISPKPVKTMKELFFVVTVKGANVRGPLLLELSMPGMYMGRNEVALNKDPEGSFSGRGVIPRCPTGRKLWQADVTIPGSGRLTYRFNVDR